MTFSHYRILALMALLLPLGSMAAELKMPDQPATEKKFMPLDNARSRQAGVTVVRPMKLRSDMDALNKGFMRIDRDEPKPMPIHPGPLVLTPSSGQSTAGAGSTVDTADAGVRVLRGAATQAADLFTPAKVDANTPDSETMSDGGSDVLGLFDDSQSPLASFHDALSGKGIIGGPLGRFGWPLPLTAEQKLTSPFGMRADPFNGKPEFHGGIDIAAAAGTPVLATAAGVVAQVGEAGNYGKFITLQHADGTNSHYGHLLGASVRQGQPVAAGQTIGAVGATGRATGAHLDYRISRNGQKLDPMQVLTPPALAMKTATR